MVRIIVVALALLISFPAYAIPCALVKAGYAPFAKYGIASARKWMEKQGYSEQTIREAMKCLSK